ncbi:MAG: hypothetical protein Q9190_006465 [Brigantiaea leucoxantha]
MATLGGEHPPTLQANPVPGDAPPEVRPESEKNGDASHTSPSGSLDGNEGKKEAPPEAPQRNRFDASEADYTWIGSAYMLAAAASTPSWGKFSDIWGRKPILLGANVLFLVASLISALSTGTKMLLAGRALQGIGGGGLIIMGNICIKTVANTSE